MPNQLWPRLSGVVAAVALTVPLALLEWLGAPLPPTWILLFAATGLTACAGLVAVWFVQRRYKLILQELAMRVTALQTNPSQQLLQTNGSQAAIDGDALLVLDRLAGLVGCYRDALVEVVRIQELAEKFRAADANRGAADDALGPTRYLGGGARRRMIARLAPNLHWIAATTPLQQFIGRGISNLVAHSFLDVVHPDDVAGLRATLQESLKDGEGHDITFRVLTPGKPGRKRSRRGDSGLSLVESHLLMDVMTSYSEAGAPLNLRCH
jgi:hypothetical protein